MKKPRQLKASDIPKLRKHLNKKQNCICPILKKKFDEKDMVVDHLHSKHAKLLNLKHGGCVRGVIHRQANSLEGKIVNSMIRLGMHKFDIPLPEILINLAAYLNRTPLPYNHPSEAPRKKVLTKASYNKLVKANAKNKKLPVFRYNKKGKPVQGLTKPLKELFELYNIEPEFYRVKK